MITKKYKFPWLFGKCVWLLPGFIHDFLLALTGYKILRIEARDDSSAVVGYQYVPGSKLSK